MEELKGSLNDYDTLGKKKYETINWSVLFGLEENSSDSHSLFFFYFKTQCC